MCTQDLNTHSQNYEPTAVAVTVAREKRYSGALPAQQRHNERKVRLGGSTLRSVQSLVNLFLKLLPVELRSARETEIARKRGRQTNFDTLLRIIAACPPFGCNLYGRGAASSVAFRCLPPPRRIYKLKLSRCIRVCTSG